LDRVQAGPTPEQRRGVCRAEVKIRIEQLAVRRKDGQHRNRHDSDQKKTAHQPKELSSCPPSDERRNKTNQRKGGLHASSALLAGPKLRHRNLRAARNPRRVLNEGDIGSRSSKEAATQQRYRL
jgi:hypothetical protein